MGFIPIHHLQHVPGPWQVRSVLRAALRNRTWKGKVSRIYCPITEGSPQRWCDLNNSFNRQWLGKLRRQLSLVTYSNYHLLPADKKQFSANRVLSQWNCQRLTFQQLIGGGTGTVFRLQLWGVVCFFSVGPDAGSWTMMTRRQSGGGGKGGEPDCRCSHHTSSRLSGRYDYDIASFG